jgi:hypothetical protein
MSENLERIRANLQAQASRLMLAKIEADDANNQIHFDAIEAAQDKVEEAIKALGGILG